MSLQRGHGFGPHFDLDGEVGQAGLFDVVVDPGFAVNGRVLLSFAHGQPEANHLRVVRARFDGRQLLDVQPIFTSQPAKTETQHFGGRMAWLADGSLLLGMGDGNLERTDAQRLHTHLGKLMRIQADGSVPRDNPFVGTAGARPEIYSRGHRNPQGLVAVDGVLYAHEHGSRGGDELNRIVAGDIAFFFIPVVWVFLARAFFNWVDERRRQLLRNQMPDALSMIVRSVRVGIPVSEAMRHVARQSQPPDGVVRRA